jgi:transposase-like protein
MGIVTDSTPALFDPTDPIFHDVVEARGCLEKLRWPNGPACLGCGETKRITRLGGARAHRGILVCNACGRQFTVTTGTMFESTNIPLNKWLLAFNLMASDENGATSAQLQQTLGIKYRAAWFMSHRIREVMHLEAEEGLSMPRLAKEKAKRNL